MRKNVMRTKQEWNFGPKNVFVIKTWNKKFVTNVLLF
jgi:hypothetical protein